MIRDQAKELQPALNHFAEGGNLWCWDGMTWCKQETILVCDVDWKYGVINIIEDKFFIERKAFALGEEIEMYVSGLCKWMVKEDPCWHKSHKYRVKPKEPVLEWQWIYREIVKNSPPFVLSKYMTEEEAKKNTLVVERYEPSRREKI